MASDSHNTRLRGAKEEMQDLKKDVNSSLADFNKASIDTTFDVISNCLNAVVENLQRHVNDIITKELNESVMSVKDSIIDALKEENFRLHQKVQHFENKLSDTEIAENKLEQYTRRNNIDIQGIPSTVHDNLLEDKVIDIFSQLNITISKSDIEDCHRLGGKANRKNTLVFSYVDPKHLDKYQQCFVNLLTEWCVFLSVVYVSIQGSFLCCSIELLIASVATIKF